MINDQTFLKHISKTAAVAALFFLSFNFDKRTLGSGTCNLKSFFGLVLLEEKCISNAQQESHSHRSFPRAPEWHFYLKCYFLPPS